MENTLFIENGINSINPAKPTSKGLAIVGSSRSNGDRGVLMIFIPLLLMQQRNYLKKKSFQETFGNVHVDREIYQGYLQQKVSVFVQQISQTEVLHKPSTISAVSSTGVLLKTMYQFSRRVTLYKEGKKMKNSGMIAYAWFIWDRNYVGKPSIEWIL